MFSSLLRRLTAGCTLATFVSTALAPSLVWAQVEPQAIDPSALVEQRVVPIEALKAELSESTSSLAVDDGPIQPEQVDPEQLKLPRPERDEVEAEAEAPEAAEAPVAPAKTQALPSGADKSGVTSQAISMPKGSGTIEGMGESFSAQLSTGIATFSVPFAIPAARGGAQASLGLSYSSGGGQGLAGLGWSVGVPFIARQTDRGLPGYDDRAAWHENQDRFVFNGGQELVPICTVSATLECTGALTIETMPRWSAGNQYFRARVEGSFLRFFWSADHLTWRVQDKSGVTMELGVPLDGKDDTSALERNPDKNTEIYKWSLVRQYDTYGDANPEVGEPKPTNVVVYKYFQDGGTAYLSDIFHTTPADDATTNITWKFAHHVRLEYELRTDPTESYRSGWKIEHRKRLKRVDVASKTFDGLSSARRQVRRYHLAYDPSSHASLLESVQVEGRCAASETAAHAETNEQLPETTGCGRLPAMRFGYSHVQPRMVDGSPGVMDLPGYEGFDERLIQLASSPDHSVDEEQADLFDINSDALPDVLVTAPGVYNDHHAVFFNGHSGKANSFGGVVEMAVKGVLGANSNSIKLSNPNVAPLDLDGDGMIDLLHMPKVKTYAIYRPQQLGGSWYWIGTTVPTASGQNVKIDFGQDAAETRVADVNFDGLVDVVYSAGTELQTFYSLGRFAGGHGQFGSAKWSSASSAAVSNERVAQCVPWSSTPVRFSDSDIQLAEMNGDGIPDIVRLRRGDIRYWPGRGNGVWGTGKRDDCPAGTFSSKRFVQMGPNPYYSDIQGTTLRVDDVNGDGLDDLVQVRYDAVDVWLNVDGKGWTERHIIEGTPASPSYATRVRLTDVNGSGTRDVLWGNAEKYQYMDLTGGIKPGLLVRVENGLGKSTDIEYSTSTAEMLAAEATGAECDGVGKPWASKWCSKMPLVAHVVKRVIENDNLDVAGQGNRVYATEYSYRDPVYEGRQREFRGFRKARSTRIGDSNSPTDFTETTFLLGECEDETLGNGVDECSMEERWRDNPKEALKGLPILTERYDASGVFLSSAHQGYRLRHLYTGLDGRFVRHAFQNGTTTFLYDTGPFKGGGAAQDSLDTVELERELGAIGSKKTFDFTPRSSQGTAKVVTAAVVDEFGNQKEATARGCVSCSPADESITSVTIPRLVTGNETAWLWRTVESFTLGTSHPGERGKTRVTYNEKGDPLVTAAVLVGGLPLDRFHSSGGAIAPPPSTAVTSGDIIMSQREYQPNLGLLVREMGANQRCRRLSYDADYGTLPTAETVYTGGCGINPLTTSASYDRGFGLIAFALDMQGQPTAVQYDEFGRLTALTRPHPINAGLSEQPSVKVQYFLPSAENGLRYSRIHTQTQDGASTSSTDYLESWAYVDGFGRTLVTLSEADTGAGDEQPWIAGSFVEYDAKSAVRRKYLPYFWNGTPSSFPITQAPQTAYGRQRYDAFGRQLQTFDLDGTVTLRSVYHALSSDLWDAADLSPGPHQGSYATQRTDGHGRTVAVTERIHVGGAIEARHVETEYLPTGEPEVISRRREGSVGGDAVVRWMRYDSLGRMVLNVEPHTTKNFTNNKAADPNSMKAWRYAYNATGDLVGTSDARGCGVNFVYDGAGRLLSEDYSPCESQHEPYTFQTAEVAYHYDSAPDEPFAGATLPPELSVLSQYYFKGRLAAVFDRASATWTSYDGRGRVIQTAVQAARPLPAPPTEGGASSPVASGEVLAAAPYTLTFGSAGSGSDSLSGFGLTTVTTPEAPGFRFFDGSASQTNAALDIAYKDGAGETITDHYPISVPPTGSAMPGGGSFDGTAYWLVHSRFQKDKAPPVGQASPPANGTRLDGTSGPADLGTNARVSDAHLFNVPIIENAATRRSFLFSAHVYAPTHEGAKYRVGVQPFIWRGGGGLTMPAGLGWGTVDLTSVRDSWNLVQVRADVETHGGTSTSSSDDTGRVTYTYWLNGTKTGAETFTFFEPYLTVTTGPVLIGAAFGAGRGNQSYVAEAFIDNITGSEIVPEGASRLSSSLLAPHETTSSIYQLDFGTPGSGSEDLAGHGLQIHGSNFSYPPNWPRRLFDPGNAQTDGMYVQAYKNGNYTDGLYGTETITHHHPVDLPAAGTPLRGGGAFDGTALWLAHGLFTPSTAPAIGSVPPLSTQSPAGVDIRTADNLLVSIQPQTNKVERRSFIASSQIYAPTHTAAKYKLLMQPLMLVIRDGYPYAVTPYGGTGYREVDFASLRDAWNLLEVRADIEVSGGALAGASDDWGRVTYTHAVNGVANGAPQTFELDPNQLTKATGPIKFGPHFFAITRGWNGHASELFVDNLIASEIVSAGAALVPNAGRYASDWSYKAFAYDGADREVAVSTGVTTAELSNAEAPGLPGWFGPSPKSVVKTDYTRRGTVKLANGSYGDLVTSIKRQADGLITELVYGDAAGTTTASSYDNRRRLRSVQTYRGPPSAWSTPPADYLPAPAPSGNPTTFQFLLQDEDYTYDVVNNPVEIRDWRNAEEWPEGAKPVTKKIKYDDLYRVTRVDYEYSAGDDLWVSPFAAENSGEANQQDPRRAKPSPHVGYDKRILWQSFQYDWLGNTTKTDDDAKGFYDRSLGAIDNNVSGGKPYQLKGAAQPSGMRAGGLDTTYDDAGNLTRLDLERTGPCLPTSASCSQRFDYQWDEVGRLVRARRWDVSATDLGNPSDPLPTQPAAADLNYAYDAGDQRVLKTAFDAAGEASHTVYLFDSLELRRATFDQVTGEYEHSKDTEVGYLSAHGVRLGRLVYEESDVPTLGAAKLHVFFELGDHLGSTSIVIDQQTSELVERSTYQAYGGAESDYRPERWKNFREDYRFTGKEDDVEVGLQYFGKRYLNPLLGRWVSADPLAVHVPGEADANVYAYVQACILRMFDPVGLQSIQSGTKPNWLVEGLKAAVRSGAAGVTGAAAYAYSRARGDSDTEARLHMARVMSGTAAVTDVVPLPVGRGSNNVLVQAPKVPRAAPAAANKPAPQAPPPPPALKIAHAGTGAEVIDPKTGKTIARDFSVGADGYVSGYVNVKGTDVSGRAAFDSAFNAAVGDRAGIKGFKGEWMKAPEMDANLNAFNQNLKNKMTVEEAARNTFTGKMAKDRGFTEVRVDLSTSKRNDDGSFAIVDVYFSRPQKE